MIFGDLPCGRGIMSAHVMRQTRVPLSQLANLLSPRVARPVEDRTGLTGYTPSTCDGQRSPRCQVLRPEDYRQLQRRTVYPRRSSLRSNSNSV